MRLGLLYALSFCFQPQIWVGSTISYHLQVKREAGDGATAADDCGGGGVDNDGYDSRRWWWEVKREAGVELPACRPSPLSSTPTSIQFRNFTRIFINTTTSIQFHKNFPSRSIFFNRKIFKTQLYSLFKNFLQRLNSISNIYFLNINVISRWFYLQHLSQFNFKWMFGNIFSKTGYFPQIFWLNFYGECFQALPGDGFRHSSRLNNFFQNNVFNTGFPNSSLMIKILTLIRCKSSFSSFVQKKAGGSGRGRKRRDSDHDI